MGVPVGIETVKRFNFGWRGAAAIGLTGLTAAFSITETPKAEAFTASEYACDIAGATFGAPAKYDLANECLRQESSLGTVALVNFNPDIDQTKKIAERARAIFADGSDDLVMPAIIPVVATQGAINEFDQRNPFCVDLDDPTKSGALIAETVMGVMADHIIALSDKPACKGPNGMGGASLAKTGVALPYRAKRYAQVVQSERLLSDPEPDCIEKFITHEGLHQFGLGHAGNIALPDMAPSMAIGSQILPNLSDDTEINVAARIGTNGVYYDEYGSPGNVMGNRFQQNGYKTLHLNALQRWRLNWPIRTLSESKDPFTLIPKYGSSLLHSSTSQNREFAIVPLEHALPGKDADSNVRMFPYLVVDPYADDDGVVPGIYELYLATPIKDSTTTASLGFLDLRSSELSRRHLLFQDQVIDIELSDMGTSVSSRPLPK